MLGKKLKQIFSIGEVRRFYCVKARSKHCIDCLNELSIDRFFKHAREADGYQRRCKMCFYHHFNNTPHSFVSKLIRTAKNSKGHPEIKSGVEEPFDIDIQYLMDMYKAQNGKCYYSQIDIGLQSGIDWQCSLERLDPNFYYTRDNVALVALEFNTQGQWTIEKINQIPHLLKTHCLPITNEILIEAWKPMTRKTKHNYKRELRVVDNIENQYCFFCHNYKAMEGFYKSRTRCWECTRANNLKYLDTLRGSCLNALSIAKKRALKRIPGDFRSTFDLSLPDILRLIAQQNFRCAYSRLPLVFKRKEAWKFSIERLDNNKGYTMDNVALICGEFNSTDYSMSTIISSTGSAQWSKEKFQYFYQTKFNEIGPSCSEAIQRTVF